MAQQAEPGGTLPLAHGVDDLYVETGVMGGDYAPQNAVVGALEAYNEKHDFERLN